MSLSNAQMRIEKLRISRETVRKAAESSGIIPDVVNDVAESVQTEFSLHFEDFR